MRTPIVFLLAAILLGFSIGSSADNAGSSAESDATYSGDAFSTQDISDSADESQDTQDELTSELTEVSKGASEAVVDLVKALRERHIDDPFVEYIAEDAVSENKSFIEKYDSDDDGGLSKNEYSHALAEHFENEESETLTPDELRDFVEEEFNDGDLDEDGKISLEEVTIYMAKFVHAIKIMVDTYDSTKRNEEGSSSSIESVDSGQPD